MQEEVLARQLDSWHRYVPGINEDIVSKEVRQDGKPARTLDPQAVGALARIDLDGDLRLLDAELGSEAGSLRVLVGQLQTGCAFRVFHKLEALESSGSLAAGADQLQAQPQDHSFMAQHVGFDSLRLSPRGECNTPVADDRIALENL